MDMLVDITPNGSACPVYLTPHTTEQEQEFVEYMKNEESRIIDRNKKYDSAIQKLIKIGLTEEEAKVIAGV